MEVEKERKVKKGRKYYLAKQSPSDMTVTSSNDDINDDVVDITEDDLPDRNEDSNTDSDSYWSPVEEEVEQVNDEDFVPQQTDNCVRIDVVQTAVLKRIESIGPKEGVRFMITKSGNIVNEERVEPQNEFELQQETCLETTEAGSSEVEYAMVTTSSSANEDEIITAYVDDVMASAAQNLADEDDASLEVFEEEEPEMHTEASKFLDYHKHIGQLLTKKTGNNGFNGQKFKGDKTDFGRRFVSVRRPHFNVEKQLAGYDVIDQFDVKVSETLQPEVSSDTFNILSKLHAFAAGFRRSLSLSKPKQNDVENSKVVRRTRSDIVSTQRQPIEEFVNLDYKKKENQSGEVVEVIIISPKESKKGDIEKNENVDGVDVHNKSDEVDGKGVNSIVDDIGTAHDLIDSPGLSKHEVMLPDDIDVISLAGFAEDGSVKKEPPATLERSVSSKLDENSDVFDETAPVRPPRKIKIQKNKSTKSGTSEMKRGSSESDLYQNAEAGKASSESKFNISV